jgi:hypothetical protein
MKSHVHTWPRWVARVGEPVETPHRVRFRFVGGTRSSWSFRQPCIRRLPPDQPSCWSRPPSAGSRSAGAARRVPSVAGAAPLPVRSEASLDTGRSTGPASGSGTPPALNTAPHWSGAGRAPAAAPRAELFFPIRPPAPGSSRATPPASSLARCSHAPAPSASSLRSLPSARTASSIGDTSPPRNSSLGRLPGSIFRRPPPAVSGSSLPSCVACLSSSGSFLRPRLSLLPAQFDPVTSEKDHGAGANSCSCRWNRSQQIISNRSSPICLRRAKTKISELTRLAIEGKLHRVQQQIRKMQSVRLSNRKTH